MADRDYALAAAETNKAPAPELPYRPQDPKQYRPAIGLIGCGGITEHHLTAYRNAGYRVVALCDLVEAQARRRQAEFYPQAEVYTDHRALLDRADIDVVDITLHPEPRVAVIEDAIRAGKHILSQKPFVLDLAVGRRLVALAEQQGVKLAVNQNGRWAPHFSYMRHAVAQGLIGQPMSVRQAVQWDHTWVKGTPFEQIHHLVLYDFAIHWFDILTCFMGEQQPTQVYASVTRAPGQTIAPPLLAQVMVNYPAAQATLTFDAATMHSPQDRTTIVGTEGTLHSLGPDLGNQRVTLTTAAGEARPHLQGTWFPDGFHGTMAELLSAIEEDRQPLHSGANNLRSLELCFAAIASAETGKPVQPGTVTRLP
ncbi:MAG: Gfo/Idh/MocA family oxidoreductase [Phycisphaeraceae bacterium]